jgi:hypothetical protein
MFEQVDLQTVSDLALSHLWIAALATGATSIVTVLGFQSWRSRIDSKTSSIFVPIESPPKRPGAWSAQVARFIDRGTELLLACDRRLNPSFLSPR